MLLRVAESNCAEESAFQSGLRKKKKKKSAKPSNQTLIGESHESLWVAAEAATSPRVTTAVKQHILCFITLVFFNFGVVGHNWLPLDGTINLREI